MRRPEAANPSRRPRGRRTVVVALAWLTVACFLGAACATPAERDAIGPNGAESPLAAAPRRAADGTERAPAIHLERDSRSSRQLVAIGRDLLIDGEALGNAVVLDGSARIGGTVGGDLVVLGGDAIVTSTGRVRGDVYAFGGKIHSEGGIVEGRSVAYPRAPSSWLLLIEGPAIGLDPFSPLVLGAKLSLLAAWMVAALVLVATFPRPMAHTAGEVVGEPFRCFFAGVVAVATVAVAVVLTSGFASVVVGIPLIVIVVLVALVLKLWGSVAVFAAVGGWLWSLAGRRRAELLEAIATGLLVLGVVKILPFVGVVAWTTATLIGIGAALRTKFGSHDPWLATGGRGTVPGI